MIGLSNEIISIMEPGSHFNTDIAHEELSNKDYINHKGKSLVHLVC
jgi:hypothetical protein